MNEMLIGVESLRKKFAEGSSNYIEVDEGWYRIILNCDAELTAIDPDYRILQIKEKFGVLRYYFSPSENCDKLTFMKMKDVVHRYEDESRRTCEATGKPGVMMRSVGGWLKTLNPEYAAEALHYAKYSVLKSFADTGDESSR